MDDPGRSEAEGRPARPDDRKRPHSTWERLRPYVRILRPDHWFKNVFMLPGIVLGLTLTDATATSVLVPTLYALVSACLVASANYTLNEYLDAEFDRHHPVKQHRSSVQGLVTPWGVGIQYVLLAAVGLGAAAMVNGLLLVFAGLLLGMGVLYNVRPFRTKDRVYLDVISESINNPIRLLMGWAVTTSSTLPPSSILLAYWFGGAYLMAMKRYAEYRSIGDPERAGLYRRSFQRYDEAKLLISSSFYSLNAAFFMGIFLIKYRVEFILSFPLFSLLFSWYLAIALRAESVAQTPEKLYRERGFVAFVVLLVAVLTVLLVVDMPSLHFLVDDSLVHIGGVFDD